MKTLIANDGYLSFRYEGTYGSFSENTWKGPYRYCTVICNVLLIVFNIEEMKSCCCTCCCSDECPCKCPCDCSKCIWENKN